VTNSGLQISADGTPFDTKLGSYAFLSVYGSGSTICAGFMSTDGTHLSGVAVSTDSGATFKTYNFGSDLSDIVFAVYAQ
jgi:hypothetical protein